MNYAAGSFLLPYMKARITHSAETAKPHFQADIVAPVSNDVPDSMQSTSQSLVSVSAQTPHTLIIDTMIMFHSMYKVHMSTVLHLNTTFIHCRNQMDIESNMIDILKVV